MLFLKMLIQTAVVIVIITAVAQILGKLFIKDVSEENF
jgi:hypothetical protein